ncbi:hypothetical protein LNP74_22025 [Klebsiella pneumoniae subsp. pneumoniae]|nr:hypothetical protein [Klebsiella pneumoniae subsp. pneumoniae]
MANGLKFSPRKTALARGRGGGLRSNHRSSLTVAKPTWYRWIKRCRNSAPMCRWDDCAQMFTLIKDGAYVKVKPGAKSGDRQR